MNVALIFLCSVILTQPLSNHGIEYNLHQYIVDSFSSSWDINVTLFMEKFENRILDCYDTFGNKLSLNVTKEKQNEAVITITYNIHSRNIILRSLCGCDPCNAQMVRFEIEATRDIVKVMCNNFGFYNLIRYDVANIPKDTQQRVYISVGSATAGCLNSFQFKRMRYLFKFTNPFLEQCPRNCDPFVCNKGSCRALSYRGPLCDCSSSPFNGPYCNNALSDYSKTSIHSYAKVHDDGDISFKLSWKSQSTDRLCLIKFISMYENMTLYVHKYKIIASNKLVTHITLNEIHFMYVTMTKSAVIVKINNIRETHKFGLFGDMVLNVGLSDGQERCDTFNGSLDFKADTSELRPILVYKLETCSICSQSQKITIVIVIVLILICGVAIAAGILLRRHQQKNRNPQHALSITKANVIVSDEFDELYDTPESMELRNSKTFENKSNLFIPKLPPRK